MRPEFIARFQMTNIADRRWRQIKTDVLLNALGKTGLKLGRGVFENLSGSVVLRRQGIGRICWDGSSRHISFPAYDA